MTEKEQIIYDRLPEEAKDAIGNINALTKELKEGSDTSRLEIHGSRLQQIRILESNYRYFEINEEGVKLLDPNNRIKIKKDGKLN